MALPDSLKRVGRYIELMDGAELPPDIAAETYTPTQVKRPPLRGNKPDEREDDTLRRSDPKALDAVLNGTCPQKLNLDIGSSADGSVTGIEGVAVSIYHGTARTLRAEEIRHGKDPSLYEIGREVLGLEDKQARALFQGPNNAGSARRWIGTQAAADACRALADGTAHEKLWEGKFDRLAIATAAAREAGADSTSYWETISWEVRGIAPGATVQPTASIADDVRIDNGAYIGENVRLESRVHVAQGATIEAGTVVRSASRIGERSHIHANCTIDGHVGDGVQIEAGARVGREREAEHEGRRPGTPIAVCGGAVIAKGVTIDKPGTVVPPGWKVTAANVDSLPARETETSIQGLLEETAPARWGNREPGSRPPGVSPEADIHPSALVLPGAQIGPGAKIGENCEIGRGAHIEGGASIGKGTLIGPGATVGADSVVENDVHVRAGATVEPECLVRRRTTIAAEAVARKGTDFGGGNASRLDGGAIASRGDPRVEELPRPWVAPARIHPNAHVHPTASIAPGATIGEGACIDANTQIGGGVQIEHHARVETGVVMEAGSRAGAGAVIRENAYVGPGADVGAWSVTEEGARISCIPSFCKPSDHAEDLSIRPLFHEHAAERRHQRTNPILGPIGEMVVQHQPLPKQRMRPPLHRVRLQPAVIADALARRTQQRQNGDRQRADQQQAVPPVRARNMHRRQPHPEAHVLDVPKARLNPPALAVVPNQDPRRDCRFAGHQAPRFVHLRIVYAHDHADRQLVRVGHPSTHQPPRTPPRRRPTRRPLAARPAHSSRRCLHATESRIRRPTPSSTHRTACNPQSPGPPQR